ncbi:MAG: hypothetical protein N3A38_07590 [Planctomycetota bacterium]|nr:hypothetical protein [Planctomycetota bacterium]
MPFYHPVLRYRPARESDGAGGFDETPGTAETIYGAIQIHRSRISMLCDADEDVLPGDLIEAAEGAGAAGSYRVTARVVVPGTRSAVLELERLDRPITPG